MKRFAICLAFLAATCAVQADVVLGWDVSGLSGTPGSVTSSVHAAGVVTGQLITRGAGLTANSGSDQFAATAWTLNGTSATAASAQDYFAFTVSPSNGFALVITNIVIRTQRSSTGPTNFSVRTSSDNYTADIATLTNTTANASNLTINVAITTSGTIEFRLYGYNAGASGGTGLIADGGDFGQAGLDLALLGYPAPGPGIPTLSEWGMIFLLVILVGAGAYKIMRQKPDAETA